MSGNPYTSPSSDVMPARPRRAGPKLARIAATAGHILAAGLWIISGGLVGMCFGYVLLSSFFARLMLPPDAVCGLAWIVPCSMAALCGGLFGSVIGGIIVWRYPPWSGPSPDCQDLRSH